MARNTFRSNWSGKSVYACRICNRNTRDTGDNGSVELCPECNEAAMCENSLSDDYEGMTVTEREKLTARINSYKQKAVNKGGTIQGFTPKK